ncbi:hypothetical protein GGR52DRAFT_565508 [Hypoxylon sp. FL1284]|nr:hypothetical protein GGR52DRAFT_565508 [Hypoxylon sp. FL1284]
MNNHSKRDKYGGQPQQIFWSDLMAVSCRRVMAVHHGNMKNLEAIWRVTITNTHTQAVITIICGNSVTPVDPSAKNTITTTAVPKSSSVKKGGAKASEDGVAVFYYFK